MESISPEDRSRAADDSGTTTGHTGQGQPIRARLNGLPCLLIGTSDSAVTGRMAVPPLAGERPPLPAKGNRATLEILADENAADPRSETGPLDMSPLEPLEITVTAASKRSGRFTARFLTITDEQWRLLGAMGLTPSPA
ncbi:hypothetical protein [Roseospira visakhapatnamensis]|uniref:Uncharacterized protein n=1 Tax=Roseospira visakhapatnamensis TaxID=390880 RepID=A0A7W6RC10_9PROT|nr:hypothetical protein [Roseospira visakhapatnamensis]MBB4265750.1 hypothetical protein [Roseospira visakhapatnamensis]